MQHHLQVKLLRALQEKEIQRVGSEKSFTVDVRVMAASNRDLAVESEKNNFRKDLYYRLSVVSLTIPALRDATEDTDYYGYQFEGQRGRVYLKDAAAEALETLGE